MPFGQYPAKYGFDVNAAGTLTKMARGRIGEGSSAGALGQASSICFSNQGTSPSVVKLSQNGRQCVSGSSAQQRLQ